MSVLKFVLRLFGWGGEPSADSSALNIKRTAAKTLRSSAPHDFRYDELRDYECDDDCEQPDERYEEGSPSEEWYNFYQDQ